jgi:putative membrane protein
MPWNYHDMGAGWLVMALFLLLIVAIAVAAVIVIVRETHRQPDERPEQILAERFARREIDADEYLHRSALLRTDNR